MELEKRIVSPGDAEFCGNSDTLRTPFLSPATTRGAPIITSLSEKKIPSSIISIHRLSVVEREHQPDPTYFPDGTEPVSLNRCLPGRLGISNERGSLLGGMVTIPVRLAYQQKRTVHSDDRSQDTRGSATGRDGDAAIRQQNDTGLHQESGRNAVAGIVEAGEGPPALAREVQDHLDPVLPPGNVQHLGGQAIQKSSPARLALESGDSENGISKVGDTGDRSVCNLPLQGSTDLRINQCDRPERSIHQRFQQAVGSEPSVGVPTPASNSKGTTALELSQGSLSAGGPAVGQDLLEEHLETQKPGCPVPTSGSQDTSDRPINGGSPSESRPPLFRGLEGTGWSNSIRGLAESEIKLLGAAWRNTSWKTYSSIWSQWRAWCKEKGIKSDNPSAQQVVAYLGYLFRERKLAYSSILTQKSAICSLAKGGAKESLSADPLVKAILKAIGIQRGSRFVALLLLLASGRRIHDLTLLSIDPDFYTVEDDKIIFWPKFGSKTDSTNYRQSGWQISRSEDRSFNLVEWIKILVSLSEERRRARKELTALFITTRGVVKAASRSIIAGWIGTALSEAGIQASPGSTRSAVASHNFQSTRNMEEVLQRCNWKGPDNFIKHYYKIIEKPNSPGPKNSMSRCFKPI
ncbi:uncharacterized protein LOC135167020 [Diachasmimorpha longicaudata]|uniref:uncharacterized protein LOC135167020 n=1 Tax=Diachasmimorpha longicaudata TaxID=58733 RepID=UPI0030B8D832